MACTVEAEPLISVFTTRVHAQIMVDLSFLVTYLPSNVLLWTHSSFLAFSEGKIVFENCFLVKLLALTESYLMIVSEKETHLCVHVRRRILTNAHEHQRTSSRISTNVLPLHTYIHTLFEIKVYKNGSLGLMWTFKP